MRGFTLIELLVVISVLALLLAMLMPAFAAVSKQARATSCRSTQRQLALSMITYAQDQDGYAVCNSDKAWWESLLPYSGIDTNDTTQAAVPWRCPEWYRSGHWRTSTDPFSPISIGLGYNHRPGSPVTFSYHSLPEDISPPDYLQHRQFTLSMITRQSARPMAGDATRTELIAENATRFFRSLPDTYWTGDPTRHSTPELQASAPRADSRANYVFYDGHVESLNEGKACAKFYDPSTAE